MHFQKIAEYEEWRRKLIRAVANSGWPEHQTVVKVDEQSVEEARRRYEGRSSRVESRGFGGSGGAGRGQVDHHTSRIPAISSVAVEGPSISGASSSRVESRSSTVAPPALCSANLEKIRKIVGDLWWGVHLALL